MKTCDCSFCYGSARISVREIRYYGMNYYGTRKVKYGAQVICNSCRARGPLFTKIIKTDKGRTDPQLNGIKNDAIDVWNRGGWQR